MRTALVAGLAAAFASVLVPATASAATPWVGLQTVATTNVPVVPPIGGTQQAFAMDASGDAVATWVAPDGKIWAAWRGAGTGWDAPRQVSTSTTDGSGTLDVAIDDAGEATLVWATNGPSSHDVVSATSTRGGVWAAPLTVATAVMPVTIDIAMNGSGKSVLAYSISQTSPVYATASASPGAAWSTPVSIADPTAGNGGSVVRVAINAGGDAVAAYLGDDGSVSPGIYRVFTVAKPAASGWPANGTVYAGNATTYTEPRVSLDATGRITVLYRNATDVLVNAKGFTGNYPSVTPTPVATGCNNGQTDYWGELAIDGNGARTIVYACTGTLYTATRAAGVDFAGASSSAQALLTLGTRSPITVLSSSANGHSVMLVGGPSNIKVYRRASSTTQFSADDTIVSPDDTSLSAEGAGVDDNGDALALLGRPRYVGGTTYLDQTSSLIDNATPTGSIAGPGTVTIGDLATFSTNFSDPFGGFVGVPQWSASDGSTEANATFDHTFTLAGTYKIDVTQSDFGGHQVKASVTVKVVNPTPTPASTPAPMPTPTPGASASTPTPGPASPTPAPTPAPPVSPIATASLSPTRFAVVKGKKGGSALSITLSSAATVDGDVALQTAGVTKTVAGVATCAKAPKKKAKGQQACVRSVPQGTLHFGSLKPGVTKIALTGKVGNKKLATGKYQLTLKVPGLNLTTVLSFTIKK